MLAGLIGSGTAPSSITANSDSNRISAPVDNTDRTNTNTQSNEGPRYSAATCAILSASRPTITNPIIASGSINIDNIGELSPGEIYLHFIDDELLEHFVQNSNANAITYNIKLDKKVFEIDVPDMKRLIGLIMAMGVCGNPSLDDYYTEHVGLFGNSLIQRVSTHKWFRAAYKVLSFDVKFLVDKINANNDVLAAILAYSS